MSTRYPDCIRGRLSAAEEAEVIELAERGLTAGQIALRLNRHPGTINYTMHRFGLKAPQLRSFSYRRGGVLVQSFTPLEDLMIERMRSEGLPTTRIAEEVSREFGHRRSRHTILTRLKMLANVEAARG